jgi:7-carboxy-7-deazaguanine synthase
MKEQGRCASQLFRIGLTCIFQRAASRMRIAEIFHSLQGEGLLTGTPSAFVRASGCNLRCWYCDTPYTSWSPEGDDLSVDDVLEQVERLSAAHAPRGEGRPAEGRRHVVLTGGEPMLWSELVPLSVGLRRAGWHITIETAGTLYLPVECDLMSLSPKLANSTPPAERDPAWRRRHEQARHAPRVIARLMAEYPYQLKFVVDRPDDLAEIERYLAALPAVDRTRVLLMPQGVDAAELDERARWLAPYCESAGLMYCPRRHIEWFGLARGT